MATTELDIPFEEIIFWAPTLFCSGLFYFIIQSTSSYITNPLIPANTPVIDGSIASFVLLLLFVQLLLPLSFYRGFYFLIDRKLDRITTFVIRFHYNVSHVTLAFKAAKIASNAPTSSPFYGHALSLDSEIIPYFSSKQCGQ
jgi:hypothetical protein